MRSLLIIPAALAIGSAPPLTAAQPRVPNSTSVPIIRTAQTVSGQPLKLPQGNSEMVASAVEIPVGGSTTIHQHPWSRFVYVERGSLRVVDNDTKQVHDFKAGQVFAEVVAQWHQGLATGSESTKLIVLDVVPPGVTNMVMR